MPTVKISGNSKNILTNFSSTAGDLFEIVYLDKFMFEQYEFMTMSVNFRNTHRQIP